MYNSMIIRLPDACLLQVMMNITFEQAARGVNKDISVNITDSCPKCDGRKHEPGRPPVVCPACHGSGMVGDCQRSLCR